MLDIEQWKEAKPYLLCVDLGNPHTAQCSMQISCCAARKHGYRVNPKNILKAISMATSVTESWKQT